MGDLSKVKVPAHLTAHVEAIRKDLSENARTPSRVSKSEWAPHIAMLMELGYNKGEIAKALQFSERYLNMIVAQGKLDGSGLVRVDRAPVPKEKLAPEYQAMLEWDPEAFIAFFNRFNHQPMPEHCREWVYEAFESDLLMLNVPPRHNKSTVFSIWWPIWNVVRDRECQVLIVSETGTLSSRWVGYIAAHLAFGEIPTVFGRFKPDKHEGEIPWRASKGELMVMGRKSATGGMQFSILSRSTGAQLLGFEADIIVMDDVTSRKIAISPTEHDEQINWLHEEVLTRLNPEGRVIVVGQRVHLQDIYGHIKEQLWEEGPHKDEPMWTCIAHPAIIAEPNEELGIDAEVLWPDVWPYKRLIKSKNLTGSHRFMTYYQQDPQSADATLVREEWLARCRDHDRSVGQGWLAVGAEVDFPRARVVSLDPSPTQYNGMVVADVVASKDQFFCCVMDAHSFKSDWHGIRRQILDVIEKYHPDYFIFERNIAQYWAKGDPFIEELRALTTVLDHSTNYANKNEVEMGLESLAFDFEMGNIRLPYGDPASKSTSMLIETEARNWTREGRKRDDVLMALWFMKWNYRKLVQRRNLSGSFQGVQAREHPYRERLRAESEMDRYRRIKMRERKHRDARHASEDVYVQL